MSTQPLGGRSTAILAQPTRLMRSLMAAGLVASLPAWAQQAPAASEEADSQKVVITANKRPERQREVAGTVSVIDGTELEKRAARDQEDTLKLTPGVQMNKGDTSSNTITIRGIGTSTTNEGSAGQQGPTGIYLEDVPMSSPIGKGVVIDPLTFDLDRVEVLRGPQGVLFGSGSLGGALRYLFNKPNMNEFQASVVGSYARVSGGDGDFSLFGMLNAPLATDTAALRVVAFDRRDPGYIDNLGSGTKDANDVHQTGGRLLLTVQPLRNLKATLVASTQKTEQGDTFSVSPDPNRLEHTAPNNSTRSTTSDFFSLTIDADIGGHTITSITGHWSNETDALIDDTELFASVGVVVPQVIRTSTGKSDATSQELRIASNPGGAFNYLAGVFYQTSDGSSRGTQVDPSALFGIATLVDLTSTGGGTERAVFFDTEYNFGGGWSAGAGARYYRTTTESSQDGTTFGQPSPSNPPDGRDSGTTPRVSVKYRFGENLWYALASKGYRYGGVNGTAPFEPFKSDSLWSYETGVRLVPMAGLQLDLAAFYLDWTDAQFTYFSIVNGLPSGSIGNVGEARSTGIEAALRYKATQSLDFYASVAYTDAETTADTEIPAGRGSVLAPSGSRLPGTPRLQAALQGNWRFAGPFDSQGRLNATYTHVGDRVMFLGGSKPADSFDTLDLGLNLSRENWTLFAGVANVTDERGVLSITGAPAGVGTFAQYFLQRPRTMTVSLRYDY